MTLLISLFSSVKLRFFRLRFSPTNALGINTVIRENTVLILHTELIWREVVQGSLTSHCPYVTEKQIVVVLLQGVWGIFFFGGGGGGGSGLKM